MNKQTPVNAMVEEARARRRGEQEALHVRNAVLVIDVSVVVFVMGCIAAVLVAVFR